VRIVVRIDGHRCAAECQEVVMSRVQLALNVRNVDEAVEFYSTMFGAEPAKRRPGYANFAIADPPLKLVLIENPDGRGDGVVGALNHLGVEVPDTAEVAAATERLAGAGLATQVQDTTTCCYAVQDKVWVQDPDGASWEVYTVLADAPAASGIAGDGTCCTGTTGRVEISAETVAAGAACC
jgi:catechol 2,3-dioxygenase-like lactoylglutathione lyase family enzyme